MERINRLTEKSKYDFHLPKKKVTILDLSTKLGKLEDLMEELNIDNVEELGKYIDDLNSYVGAYANDPPEKTQQIVKDLNTVAKLRKELGCPLEIFIKIMLKKIKEIIVNYGDAGGYEPLYYEYTKACVDGIIEQNDKFFIETNLCGVPIEDYKKNWWLPSDKEWKDEK